MNAMPTTNDTASLWRAWCALPPPAPGQQRYLLVNQAAWSAQRALLRDLGRLPRQPLLGQGADACEDGATPFVVPIEHPPGPDARSMPLHALCSSGAWACALHLIDSPLTLPALAHALGQRCQARLSDGQEMVLRYFDTRVLAALRQVWPLAHMQALVACTGAWRYANRQAQWEAIELPHWPQADTFQAPWQLQAEQEDALMQASEPDAVIDVLMRQSQPQLLTLPPAQRYETVRELLHRARAWRLEGPTEQAAYCAMGLAQGRDFDQQEPWPTLLQQVREGRMSWSQALEQLCTPTP